MKTRMLVLALLVLALTGGELVDRIAAIVNDQIILLSEVDEKLFILQTQGQLQDIDTSDVVRVRREILDRLIEEKLVLQRAHSQGIEVDNTEVMNRVNEAMDQVRSRFPSLDAFREALAAEGITETMLRDRYRSDTEQEMLGQRIVGREVRNKVQINSEDIQRYYDENSEDLPHKPMEVELSHILARPVSEEEDRKARERITAAREMIMAGQSFESIAGDASDDPSRTRGGMLGWFSPGDLDTDFEATVDTLVVNQLSEVVRTQFGYHLIEVLERDGSRFRVRHILAMVQPSQVQLEEARARAVEAWKRVTGGESFAEVALEMSDDPSTRENGGNLGWTATEVLLPGVKEVVDTLEVGGVSPVLTSDRGFHVFRVTNRRTGGEFTYEEIKDQLRGFLEQKKLTEAYDEWMVGIRDSAYVEIKAWER